MIEEKREVKVYRVFAKCECGGELNPTGVAYSSYPEQYPHVCDKCGKAETLWKLYPRIIYEEIIYNEKRTDDGSV